ncbi:cell division protein FtsQ/DivIB [Brevundimonas sp. UBA2416]|uniref:cell division protein FtsQ/DivIB n=1 Tax=Brevundimonas sp. UBA2416 TaxID=1946124 RepID=UPI0025C29F34|nr:cell division protein FtsQ/DivIB [Brevundimonas sp. UBA2416]
MPAVMRGAGRGSAKPRAKAPANRGAGPRKASQAPRPAAKLRAARGVLPPMVALGVVGGVLALGLIVTLATGDRGERLAHAALASSTGGLGFKLEKVHIQGASPMAQQAVLDATGLYKGQPILDVDLEKVRQSVTHVGWVKDAQIVRLLPDTLVIAVKERETLAVWQTGGRTFVIDGGGRAIPEADPGRFPQLPLIVGEGANDAAAAILPAVQSRPRLRDRLEALVRVDGRRWDLRLKDGGIVQLPAVDEESALIRLDQLDERQRILELGFERIDLREPGLIALRPRDTPLPAEAPVSAGV